MGSYCLLHTEFLFCKLRSIQNGSVIYIKTTNVLNANDLYAIMCFIAVFMVFRGLMYLSDWIV